MVLPIRMPNVSFSWLGELPSIMEESRGREAREGLADLDVTTSKGMREAASRLLKSGNLRNMERAERLFAAATAKDESTRRQSQDLQYLLFEDRIKKLLGSGAAGGTNDPTGGYIGGQAPSAPEPAPAPNPNAAPPPPAFPPPPPMPAPQSAVPQRGPQTAGLQPEPFPQPAPQFEPVPDPAPPAPPATLNQRMLPLTDPIGQRIQDEEEQRLLNERSRAPVVPGQRIMDPQRGPGGRDVRISQTPETSEGILAAAEGGGAPLMPPRGPATAQLGPPQPMLPNTPNVPWVQGAQQGPLGVPSGTPSQPAADDTADIQRRVEGTPPAERLNAIGSIMSSLGPRASRSQQSVLEGLFKAELARQAPRRDQGWLNWQQDNFERIKRGERPRFQPEFNLINETAKGRYEAAQKLHTEHQEMGDKATAAEPLLQQIQDVISNPDILTGPGSGGYLRAMGFLTTMHDAAKNLVNEYKIRTGQDIPFNMDLKALSTRLERTTDPARRAAELSQALTSLSNQLLFARVKSLGANFSEGDRAFTTAIYPNPGALPATNKYLTKMMLASAQWEKAFARESDAWMLRMTENNPTGISREALRAHMQNWKDQNPLFRNKDGSHTALGAELARNILGKKSEREETPFSNRVGQAIERVEQGIETAKNIKPTDLSDAVGGVVNDISKRVPRFSPFGINRLFSPPEVE